MANKLEINLFYYFMQVEYTYPQIEQHIEAVIPVNYRARGAYRFRNSKLLVICRIICGLIFFICLKCLRSSLSVLDIFLMNLSINVGQPLNSCNTRDNKLVLLFLMSAALFLTAAFNSKLTRDLTVPMPPQVIETLKELTFHESYELKVPKAILQILQEVLDDDIFAVLNESRVNSTGITSGLLLLRELEACKTQGIIGRSSLVRSYKAMQILRNSTCYGFLKEKLMPSWTTYIFTYGSPFLPHIDKILARVHETGLDKSFVKVFYKPNYLESGMHKIDIPFFQSLVSVIILGYVVALVVFLLEVAYFRRHL